MAETGADGRTSEFNERVVLNAIRESDGGLSQPQLQALTALAAPTVSRVIRSLRARGLVSQVGTRASSSAGGKPSGIYGLRAEASYAIGIHLDPRSLTVVLTDFACRVRGSASRSLGHEVQPEDAVRWMRGMAKSLLAQHGVDEHSRLRGVGLSVPGPIDFQHGAVIDAPNLNWWPRQIPLRDLLSEAFGANTATISTDWLPKEICLENDATAAAIGERLAGVARGLRNFAYIYLSVGIGGGVCLDGRFIRGSTGNAWEIGHMTIDFVSGEMCRCGRRGCVEAISTPRAIVRKARARLRSGALSLIPPEKVSPGIPIDDGFDAVCSAARRGDGLATELLEESNRALAAAIGNVLMMCDVEQVILGGPVVRHAGDLLEPVLNDAVLHAPLARRISHPRVVLSRAEHAAAVGAAARVLEVLYEPDISQLQASNRGGVR